MNFKSITPPLLAICALVGLLLGIVWVIIGTKESITPIPFPPSKCPFEHCVAAVGYVQPLKDELWIGTPLPEIVERIFVKEGEFISEGTPIFSLCTDLLEAKKAEAKSAYAVALAEYSRGLSLPREESIPPLEAAFNSAQAEYEDRLSHFFLYKNVDEPKAISIDELNQRKWAATVGKYKQDEAKAKLDLLLAGAWAKDLEVLRARVMEAKSAIDIIEVNIARSIIRAPNDGEVLKININEGEFVSENSVLAEPHIRFGETRRLRVLVNVDEEEIWRVFSGAKGRAYVRGNSSIYVDLEFNRIQPLVIPKQSLTGRLNEKIDVRVLQVIYEFERKDLPIYPGELVDVYLEGRPSEASS